MSFGGSSSSFTLPHTHNNALSNDGGALSETLTYMGTNILFNLIKANEGKWSATNTQTFRNSVIVGAQAGTIEEVT